MPQELTRYGMEVLGKARGSSLIEYALAFWAANGVGVNDR